MCSMLRVVNWVFLSHYVSDLTMFAKINRPVILEPSVESKYRSPSVSGQSGGLFYNICANIGEILREIYMGFYWEFSTNLH